jgi:hypothetical protein
MSFTFKKELSQSTGEYAPIAPGVYTVQFESLEEKPTLAGGEQWSAKMKIPATNRTFFLNWNVVHENPTVQTIAREQISQIADLLGVGDDISIESIKTNKQFVITLEQRPVGDKTYYQVKGKWKLAEVAAPLAPKAPEKKAPPWQKK